MKKIAEAFLNKLEQSQNFGQLVLQLIATKSFDLHIRFAASLLFKNFVRRNWVVTYLDQEATGSMENKRVFRLRADLWLSFFRHFIRTTTTAATATFH